MPQRWHRLLGGVEGGLGRHIRAVASASTCFANDAKHEPSGTRFFLIREFRATLAALQAKGYPLGPGKLMQVEELLQGLPPDTAPERLRSLLAPLFASSAEEQRAFYALFDRVRAGLEDTPNPGPDIASGPQPAGKKKRRWWSWCSPGCTRVASSTKARAGRTAFPAACTAWV
jgi:hypothetical protein